MLTEEDDPVDEDDFEDDELLLAFVVEVVC